MTDALIVYGTTCVWWDSIDKVAIMNTPNRAGHGLPVCPFCRCVLYQMSTTEWWDGVDRYERMGHPGYRRMVEWWRGRCFPSMDAMREAYQREVAA